MFSADFVLDVLDHVPDGIVDGGWGIDALIGRVTRVHDDLDLVIPIGRIDAVVAVRRRSITAALIVFAFLAAWLPFVRVTRVMFLYHMFGGLPFMMLAVAFAIARLRRFELRIQLGPAELPAITGTHLALAYLGMVVLVFLFFYPLWTGLPLTGEGWMQRIWFSPDTTRPYLFDLNISWV